LELDTGPPPFVVNDEKKLMLCPDKSTGQMRFANNRNVYPRRALKT